MAGPDFLTPSDAPMPAPPGPAVHPLADPERGTWSSARLWAVVIATGAVAGAVGIGVTALLHAVQHLSFGYTEDSFLLGVERARPARRVVVLTAAGAVAGLGWLLLRRVATVSSVGAAIGPDPRPLPVTSTTADGCLQVAVVGMGASLGREGAPRQIAAAIGGRLAERCRLDADGRRIVIACGAGAGLAAVYNVPLAGCLFTAEVLLATLSMRVVTAALLCSSTATAVSWLALPDEATYRVGGWPLRAPEVAFAVLVGPVAGLAAWGFGRAMTRARSRRPTGWRLPLTTVPVLAALGVLSCAFPALLGNGKGPTDLALTGALAGGTALVLAVLKPVVTAACLRSGAVGGLLTPSMATGALLGAGLGQAWSVIWPGGAPGVYALIGATALLTVTQRAPLCAVALAVELTRAGTDLLVPLTLAAALAYLAEQLVVRRAQVLPRLRATRKPQLPDAESGALLVRAATR